MVEVSDSGQDVRLVGRKPIDPMHQFDYQTHEVAILVPERVEPLASYFRSAP